MPSDNEDFTKEKKIEVKSQEYPKGFTGGPPCPVSTIQQYPKGFLGGPPCPVFKSQQYPKGFPGGPPYPRAVNIFEDVCIRIPSVENENHRSYSYFQKETLTSIGRSQIIFI